MPAPDPQNIIASDPNDYIYVSKKNYARKQNIVNGGDSLGKLIGRPGVITGIILTLVDMVVTFIIRFALSLMKIATFSFNWVNNIIFGNFQGVIPSSLGKGKVITMKFFRYTMTVLMPPFGVMLSKGVYGWFSICICMLLTYIHYLAGIIYAFVITARNRYADQYEDLVYKQAMDKQDPVNNTPIDNSALISVVGFFIVLALTIYLFLRIF
jgi:uncharacterized membrane protein YqaE (UPF0057 family)